MNYLSKVKCFLATEKCINSKEIYSMLSKEKMDWGGGWTKAVDITHYQSILQTVVIKIVWY